MEKIYEEKEKNSKKRKKNSTDKSVVWSFLLVAVAFVSIVGLGFRSTSYAFTDVNADLGDSITTSRVTDLVADYEGGVVEGSNFTNILSVNHYQATTSDGRTLPIFCLEHDVNFVSGTLTKSEIISDYGLLYLMSIIYGDGFTYNGRRLDDFQQIWLSQVSIWNYLYGGANNLSSDISAENLQRIHAIRKKSTSISENDIVANYNTNVYDLFIKGVVEKAKSYKDNPPATAIQASIAGTSISLTNDEKYYQSELVSVVGSPSDNFENYSVELTAPEGSTLIGEDGNAIGTENLSPGTKFYIRVPVDKMTENNKVVKLSISGNFKKYSGYYYKAAGAQTVSSVYTTPEVKTTGLEIPFNYTPNVPDTARNQSRSIYFIGLIILLTGAGIIYVNVRPKAVSK